MPVFKHDQNQSSYFAVHGSDSGSINENFVVFIDRLGLSPQDVCLLCERSPRTVRNWMVNNPPGWVYIFLKAYTTKSA